MVNYSLSKTFMALADPTRREILALLSRGTASVTELAQPFEISLPAVSKHLRVLENAGLLHRHKAGRRFLCRLAAEPIQRASLWIGRYRVMWEQQLKSLGEYVEETAKNAGPLSATPAGNMATMPEQRRSPAGPRRWGNRSPLNLTFSALADPTRRQILARLAQGETSVSELAAPFCVSLPAVSKHLRVLESAGLMDRRREGRRHRCRIVATPMKTADAWLNYYQRFWQEQFNALGRYLESTKREDS